MKNKSMVWNLIFSVAIVFGLLQSCCTPPTRVKQRYVDYPEEINEGVQGDTLLIIRSSPDTLVLGFTGKHI